MQEEKGKEGAGGGDALIPVKRVCDLGLLIWAVLGLSLSVFD